MSDSNGLARIFRSRYDFFEALFFEGRIEELVNAFYTDNAVVEGFGLSPQIGKAAIARAFAGAREAGFVRIKINADAPAVASGDLVYQFITNDNITGSGEVHVHRAIVVWRNTPQGWKCEVDFFCPKAGS